MAGPGSVPAGLGTLLSQPGGFGQSRVMVPGSFVRAQAIVYAARSSLCGLLASQSRTTAAVQDCSLDPSGAPVSGLEVLGEASVSDLLEG